MTKAIGEQSATSETCETNVVSSAPSMPPAPSQANTGDQTSQEELRYRRSPKMLRDVLVPSLMHMANGFQQDVDTVAFKAYRDALVREAGCKDILEQVLVEQISMAHLASFHLQGKAGVAATPEAAGIYAAAATKMMGEIRRTVIAIKELRNPAPSRAINIATTQQVTMSGKAEMEPDRGEEKNGRQSEIGSNHGPGHYRLRQIFGEDRGRSSKPAIAGAID